ncbi:MAG: AtpZ/AtpI family protein [bacterium]|nr:AtpZ/AtpI family protein [bacterium]
MPPDKRATIIRQVAPYLNLGSQLAASVLVLGAAGWFIDQWQGSEPTYLLIGLVLGCVVGFVQFFRSLRRWMHGEKEPPK